MLSRPIEALAIRRQRVTQLFLSRDGAYKRLSLRSSADSSSRRYSAAATVRRAAVTASGFTDTEVMPNLTSTGIFGKCNARLVGSDHLLDD